MLKEMLENVKKVSPLIHNITNYVTVNDCANILLACGGSPTMADDIAEVEEITTICDGLNINIGTLNQRTVPAMMAAGKMANLLGHPVVFDPVGVGASNFRTETARHLLEKVQFTVIRGNSSEIKTLALGSGKTHGVDADLEDQIREENIEEIVAFIKNFAAKTNTIAAVTGVVDIVANGKTAYCIYNGHPLMSRVTGTGCQLSALTAAYVTANQQTPLLATAAAVCAMGICGEKAQQRMDVKDGNATYRNYIIDAMAHLDGETLERCAKYEIC